MHVPEKILEVKQHLGDGYQPLVDYGEWRVAILRFEPGLKSENIDNLQRHDETDEVFVLLQGRCVLFLASGDQTIDELYPIELESNKLYNVRKASWHNHVLSEDAVVLVVENMDTTYDNSPRVKITDELKEQIQSYCKSIGL